MMTRPLLALALAALAVMPLAAQTPADLDAAAARLDALVEEMDVIEQLNSLQLTADQIRALQTQVAAISEATTPILATRIEALQQLEPLLTQKRQALIADQQPADDLLDRISAIEEQLSDLDVAMDETIVSFAPRIRALLTEPQIAMVSGEEDARRQVVMLLEVIRDMDAERFNREAPGYAGKLERLDAGISAQTIMNLFTTARNLGPDEYQAQQPEIVKGLLPIYAPSDEVADAMTAHFFAQPAMPRLLEDKLRATGNNP